MENTMVGALRAAAEAGLAGCAVVAAGLAAAVAFFPASFPTDKAYRRAADGLIWCLVIGLLSTAAAVCGRVAP